NNQRNVVHQIEGSQTDSRAALFGVLKAIIQSKHNKPLTIYTSSQYAIRSFCYWAGENATRGWTCTHADVLKETS
ncbi:hypothetical protein DFH09DRAFT_814965, partial [Mycena vulgaris]